MNKIIHTDYEIYKVIIAKDEGTFIEGSVYPVEEWYNIETEDSGYAFRNSNDGTNIDELDEFCECAFCFSYVWRGVWEGRIYFQEEEYWSEDLTGMSQLWEKLKLELQEQIKLNNPNYTYE
jgi:hypothetical protein